MHEYQQQQRKLKNEKVYDCKDCGKKYTSSLGLKFHTYSHTGERPYRCDHNGCTRAFTSNAGLKYHLLVHSGQRPYSCVQCGAKFRTIAHVQNHVVKHSDVRCHQCEVCGLAFYNKKELSGHKKIHSKSSQLERSKKKPKMPCEYCGKLFNSSSGLESHLRSHTGDRPYSCTTCSKAYTNLAGLLYHMKTHSGERNFQCATCDSSFSSQNGLKIHERTHTGEKPFKCSKCEQSYTSQSNLTAHQRSHTRAWLASHQNVQPRPVSSYAIKMRKYREKLKKDPSLTPPSLQGKQKWRAKKPETLRRYRDKLKALDRLRSLPDHEAFDSKRFVESMLELGGRSATKDNIETAEAEIKSLLPRNLVVVDSSRQDDDRQDLGSEGQQRLVKEMQNRIKEEHTYWKSEQTERSPLDKTFHRQDTQDEGIANGGNDSLVNEKQMEMSVYEKEHTQNMQQEEAGISNLYKQDSQSTFQAQGIHDVKVELSTPTPQSHDHSMSQPDMAHTDLLGEANKGVRSDAEQQDFKRMVVRLEVDMPTDRAQQQQVLRQLELGGFKVHNCHLEEKVLKESLPVMVVDGLHQQGQQQNDHMQQSHEEESQQHIIVIRQDQSDIVSDATTLFLKDDFYQQHQTPQQIHKSLHQQHQASQLHHPKHLALQQQHLPPQHNRVTQQPHHTPTYHHQNLQKQQQLSPQEETVSIIYIDQQEIPSDLVIL